MEKISLCSNCLTPTTRPRIEFHSSVCNACLNSQKKQVINWDSREKELLKILEKFKSSTGEWDCIVPYSGGKDSATIAHKLKKKYGMNPLLITFSPLIPNEIGKKNVDAFIDLGFDNFYFRPNGIVSKKLGQRFFIERGNPKVAWDAGVNVIPVLMALKFNIKLIFYAEHGESEYGGKVISENSTKIRNFTEVIEHQIGDDPLNWISEEISKEELNGYIYPDLSLIEKNNIKVLYFSYFEKWSMFSNYEYIKNKFSFTTKEGRTNGTFTNFDSLDDKIDDLYYYMQFIKFGFGRCIRDCSRLIQNNQMERKKAIELCKMYDGEYPNENLEEVLSFLDLNTESFNKIIDLHRNQEIWKKNNKGSWENKISTLLI